MKQIIFILLLFVSFYSCTSTYYYSTVSSVNESNQLDNGNFVDENDSILVAYSFDGIDGPVKISIFNKSEKPLYVNWQESSLVVDGEAIPYFDTEIAFSGASNGASLQIGDIHPMMQVSESDRSFSGNISLPQNISFIPPKAKINYSSLKLNPYHILKLDKKNYTKESININSRFPLLVQTMNFDDVNTPLYFRSYLSMYYDQSQTFHVDDAFYISKILKTTRSPKNLPADMSSRGDIFYVEDINSTGAYIAVGLVATGAVVYGATKSTSNDDL